MSGHSHWATIQRKKAVVDAKKGKAFSKFAKAIMIAARQGGGNPDANLQLKYAIGQARAMNMAKDNIDRAIKKGTGELDGEAIEQMFIEGYAVGGVAVLIDSMTDNRNRTLPEIRKIFEKNAGNMGGAGCVAWIFSRIGSIMIKKEGVDEEKLLELAIEAGARDMKTDEPDVFEIVTAPEDFSNVSQAVRNAGIEIGAEELTMSPSTLVKITDVTSAKKVLQLIDELDSHDDVQNVYANHDIPEEIMKKI